MKKLIFTCVFLFVASFSSAWAGQLGNPAKLIGQGRFDVGFQWNNMFKQGFEDYDLKRTYQNGYRNDGRKGAEFENDQYYMGTITYGIIDQINVFAQLGIVDGGKWLDQEAGNNWKADLQSNFVWAIGAKGKIYEFQNGLGFGLGAQYMRYDNRKAKNWRSTDTGETSRSAGLEHRRQSRLLAAGYHGQCLLDDWCLHPLCGGRLHLLRCELLRALDP